MQICDEWLGTSWKDYEFAIDNIPALGVANEIDANSVLSVNEGRQAIGYQELDGEDGKQMIKSTTAKKQNVQN